MTKAKRSLRASDILNSARRRPVLAAIAVPTAAAAAITAAGFAAAPGADDEPQAFESKAAPQADEADGSKAGDEAAKKAKKSQDSAELSLNTPEPKPKPKPKSTGSSSQKKSSSTSSSTSSSGSKSTKSSKSSKPSTSKKSEPKANSKASGKSGTCKASYYGSGQQTATGERFNPNELTAAHKTLPFNSRVKVTNKANGKSVTVRINDRGPFVSGRCLDLSTAAMKAVGGEGSGVITAEWQVL